MNSPVTELEAPIRPKGLSVFTIIWVVLILISVGIDHSLNTPKGSHYPAVMYLMPLVWLLVLVALWKGRIWARQLLIILFGVCVPYWKRQLVRESIIFSKWRSDQSHEIS